MEKILVSTSTVETLEGLDYEKLSLDELKEIKYILSEYEKLAWSLPIKFSKISIKEEMRKPLNLALPNRMHVKDLVLVDSRKVEEFTNNLIKKIDLKIGEIEKESIKEERKFGKNFFKSKQEEMEKILIESLEGVLKINLGEDHSINLSNFSNKELQILKDRQEEMEKILIESLAEILPNRIEEYRSINLATFSNKELQMLLENVKLDYHCVLKAITNIHEKGSTCKAVLTIGKPEYLYIIDLLQKRIERAFKVRNI